MRFEIIARRDPARAAVEAMVRTVFEQEYGARIAAFPALMIAVLDNDGRPQCAAGLRDGESGFFSEYYLDHPVEQLIAAQAARPVARDEILELGSLAACRPGGLLVMLQGFAGFGLGAGYRWGIFTATARLRRLAQRLGLRLADLGPAIAERVPEPQLWGSYYAHAPRVCAIEGQGAMPRLADSRLPCGAGLRLRSPEAAE